MSWKKVSGVLCDRKLSARVKRVKCTTETVAVTERQLGKMEDVEWKL